LEPAAQVAMTQAPPWHIKVPPVPGLGQVEESQVASPQPYEGSLMVTHADPHFLVPAPHVPTMQTPL
jgi:hypothetical protein